MSINSISYSKNFNLKKLSEKAFRKLWILPSLFFIGIFLLNASALFAQKTQSTEHKADSNLKSSARVNPSTLAMEFSLPLGNYPGRNGNSTPIVLNYSSKVWDMERFNFRQETIQTGNSVYPYRVLLTTDILAIFSKKSFAGWTSSLQPPAIVEHTEIYNQDGELFNYEFLNTNSQKSYTDSDGDGVFSGGSGWSCEIRDSWGGSADNCLSGFAQFFVEVCKNSGTGETRTVLSNTCYAPVRTVDNSTPTPITTTPPQIAHKVKRVRVLMPDGSSHEFRKDDYVYNCQNTPNACSEAKDGIYLSVDGTRLRLERGVVQPNTEKRDVLYLPDGGRFIFAQVAQPSSDGKGYILAEKFIDKDGNVTEYNLSNQEWTDTLGRKIKNPFPDPGILNSPTATTQEISLKGINNQDITYNLVWKPLSQAFEFSNTQLKYIGADKCQSELMNPVSGPSLFSNQPGDPDTTPDPNQSNVEFVRNQRVCASSWGAEFLFDPVVLSEIILPDDQKYKFEYNEYAEITKITYPTAGYERFIYEPVPQIGFNAIEVYSQGNRGVKQREVNFDSSAPTQTWLYNYNGTTATTTAPDGSKSERDLINASYSNFGMENPLVGMATEERIKDSTGQLRSRILTEWKAQDAQGTGAYPLAQRDPRPEKTISITIDPVSTTALATMTETTYDTNAERKYFAHLNPKLVKSTHYVTISKTIAQDPTKGFAYFSQQFFSAPQFAAASQTDYLYDSYYLARGIIGLPERVRVLNPSTLDLENPLAKTETVYDEPTRLVTESGTLSGNAVNTWIDPTTDPKMQDCINQLQGKQCRGNPTTVKMWHKEGNSWIQAHTQYDQFGNERKFWDGSGDTSRYTETQYSSDYAFAYPTKVITPPPDPGNTHGTDQTSKVETVYDLATGLPTKIKDDFDQVTETQYDNMLRPKKVLPIVVNDAATGPITETEYGVPNDGVLPESQRFVRVKKQIDANNWDVSTVWFDGLGRTIKTQAKDSQGDVFVETKYDIMGRVLDVSNPYRQGDSIFWNRTKYDTLGRVEKTFAPSADPINQPGASLGTTSYGISATGSVGIVMTTTDTADIKRRSITNALGQVVRVDEPEKNNRGNLDSADSPTYYTYDHYGKIVRVQQGSQNRYFKYDSLGRLIRVNQPEQEVNLALNLADSYNSTGQWTAAFSYDALGNVKRATDSKGVNIVYEYDKARRPVKRCYTIANVNLSPTILNCSQVQNSGNIDPNTPTVQYFYDGQGLDQQPLPSPNLAKGKLTKVASSISETRYTLFDNFGRLKASEQRTPFSDSETAAGAQPRVSTYKYNLSGLLIEQTYPNGRVVKNEFETDGDLMRVYGKASSSASERTYANSFSYTPAGGISQMKLGNGKWETTKFNNRLQLEELGLGNSATDASTWKIVYDYSELNATGNVVNNGNITKQTISFSGLTQPFIQTYKYDSLYRLTEAKETINGGQQNWIQTYDYDRYGNRVSFYENVGGIVRNQTPAVEGATNRFVLGQGYSYDKNGNVTNDIDPVTSQARQFIFNGNNKQTEVKNSGGVTTAKYYYDGEGKRVKKRLYHTDGVTIKEDIIFVYDGMGRLVAEYSTQPSTDQQTKFLTEDHLGTPRIITNQLGVVVARRDFMPFGEELFAGVGGRTGDTGQKYAVNADSVRQKFTGYQKDKETSLDFAEARMYDNRHGRFTAVDPLLASGKSANPQTFNRYSYTSNNPVIRVDKNGKDWYVAFEKINGRWYIYPNWCRGLGCNGYRWGSSGSFKLEGVNYRFDARSFAFQDARSGKFLAYDFYESRKPGEFGSLREAQAQVQAWNRQAAVNFIAGALSGYSIVFEFSGAAEGMKAETGSKMFEMGKSAGTGAGIASIFAGAGLATTLISKLGKGIRIIDKTTGAGITVLGHYPLYEKLAKGLEANYLNIPTKVWDKMTDAERWAVNQKFLDEAIERGDEIILATPANMVKPGSFFERELNYLFSKGFNLSADGTRLVRTR